MRVSQHVMGLLTCRSALWSAFWLSKRMGVDASSTSAAISRLTRFLKGRDEPGALNMCAASNTQNTSTVVVAAHEKNTFHLLHHSMSGGVSWSHAGRFDKKSLTSYNACDCAANM